jgi:hypothetical protein
MVRFATIYLPYLSGPLCSLAPNLLQIRPEPEFEERFSSSSFFRPELHMLGLQCANGVFRSENNGDLRR